MTVHRVRGARGTSLLRSLGALGLVRLLATQHSDPVRCRYEQDDLLIDTGIADIPQWLVDDYAPSPVLSPWNGGSGFGEKDKEPKRAIQTLVAHPSARLDSFRAGVAVAEAIVDRSRDERWDKPELIRRLRAQCPDAMVDWLDAAVVLLDAEALGYPPLLGTGGNDGRLEFSSNFHQRLVDALPSGEKSRQQSLTWASDFVSASESIGLPDGAAGQFDPGATGTPGSSPFGAAKSLINPWSFILAVEGTLVFRSAPARRLGALTQNQTRAAFTFMTFSAPYGSATGSAQEDTRGDVWMPYFDRWFTWPEVRQLFTEGRAVWKKRTPVQAHEMYLAAASSGVADGIAGLDRFTFAKRNGLAFSAVPSDSVAVRHESMTRLVALIEEWPDRVGRVGEASQAVRHASRAFNQARIDVARARTDAELVNGIRSVLARVTALDLAVARSGRLRDDLPVRIAPDGRVFDELMAEPRFDAARSAPEFRIALGLASLCTDRAAGAPNTLSMRELLLPISPAASRRSAPSWRPSARVGGYSVAPLATVLADVARYLLIGGYRGEAELDVDSRSARPTGLVQGTRYPRQGRRVPTADLHAWIHGEVDSELLADWFAALLALDWRRSAHDAPLPRIPLGVPDPTLALLAPFRDGITATARPELDPDEPITYALATGWISQLQAGQTTQVHNAAANRLKQLGYAAVSAPLRKPPAHGVRLAAALVPRSTGSRAALARVTRRLASATASGSEEPTHDETSNQLNGEEA